MLWKKLKVSPLIASLDSIVVHKLLFVVKELSSYGMSGHKKELGKAERFVTIRQIDVQQVEKTRCGSYDYRFEANDEMLTVRWKDSKAVAIASNFDTILLGVRFSAGPIKVNHASQLCSCF